MTATIAAYKAAELDLIRRGVRYNQGPGRCDPRRSGYTDCSGSICALNAYVGGHDFGCTGSFSLTRQAHDLVRRGAIRALSIEDALHVPGALLSQGANEGQGALDGSKDGVWPGHIGTAWGDGRTTWEARGTRAGVGLFVAGSLRWDWACEPWPWLADSGAPTSPKPRDVAYANAGALEDDDMLLMPPTRLTPKGRVPSARAIPEFNFVLLEDGARLVGDHPVGDPADTRAHFWAPPKEAEVPGWQLVGVMRVTRAQCAAHKLSEKPHGYVILRYQYPNQKTGTYAAVVAT